MREPMNSDTKVNSLPNGIKKPNIETNHKNSIKRYDKNEFKVNIITINNYNSATCNESGHYDKGNNNSSRNLNNPRKIESINRFIIMNRGGNNVCQELSVGCDGNKSDEEFQINISTQESDERINQIKTNENNIPTMNENGSVTKYECNIINSNLNVESAAFVPKHMQAISPNLEDTKSLREKTDNVSPSEYKTTNAPNYCNSKNESLISTIEPYIPEHTSPKSSPTHISSNSRKPPTLLPTPPIPPNVNLYNGPCRHTCHQYCAEKHYRMSFRKYQQTLNDSYQNFRSKCVNLPKMHPMNDFNHTFNLSRINNRYSKSGNAWNEDDFFNKYANERSFSISNNVFRGGRMRGRYSYRGRGSGRYRSRSFHSENYPSESTSSSPYRQSKKSGNTSYDKNERVKQFSYVNNKISNDFLDYKERNNDFNLRTPPPFYRRTNSKGKPRGGNFNENRNYKRIYPKNCNLFRSLSARRCNKDDKKDQNESYNDNLLNDDQEVSYLTNAADEKEIIVKQETIVMPETPRIEISSEPVSSEVPPNFPQSIINIDEKESSLLDPYFDNYRPEITVDESSYVNNCLYPAFGMERNSTDFSMMYPVSEHGMMQNFEGCYQSVPPTYTSYPYTHPYSGYYVLCFHNNNNCTTQSIFDVSTCFDNMFVASNFDYSSYDSYGNAYEYENTPMTDIDMCYNNSSAFNNLTVANVDQCYEDSLNTLDEQKLPVNTVTYDDSTDLENSNTVNCLEGYDDSTTLKNDDCLDTSTDINVPSVSPHYVYFHINPDTTISFPTSDGTHETVTGEYIYIFLLLSLILILRFNFPHQMEHMRPLLVSTYIYIYLTVC